MHLPVNCTTFPEWMQIMLCILIIIKKLIFFKSTGNSMLIVFCVLVFSSFHRCCSTLCFIVYMVARGYHRESRGQLHKYCQHKLYSPCFIKPILNAISSIKMVSLQTSKIILLLAEYTVSCCVWYT